MRTEWTLALTLALGLGALPAPAAELAGARLDDTTQVGDASLVLNGIGLRKKLFVQVYVGGLYLPAKERDAAKILAADTPRRIVMQFVRNVGKGSLCDAWKEGLANNTPNANAEVRQGFDQICAWMEDVASGDQVVFTYDPASGTTVDVRGKGKGAIAGKPFADAVFGCFIGPTPPTAELKKALLGG